MTAAYPSKCKNNKAVKEGWKSLADETGSLKNIGLSVGFSYGADIINSTDYIDNSAPLLRRYQFLDSTSWHGMER